MSQDQKEIKISFWASHFTTIVSVTLVLLLGGIIALIWISADSESRRLKERLELSVILADSISDSTGRQLAREISDEPYSGNVKFVSKSAAMQAWKQDTGEDLQEIFGVNPLSPEVDFTVKSEYVLPDSLAKISAKIRTMPGVESVESPEDEMIDNMNRNIATLTLVLGAVGLFMILISFVLINNTVHLAIYARRFIIHTMQLVGATNSFIRRPIVVSNALSGLISGIVASGLLVVAIWGLKESGLEEIGNVMNWGIFSFVAVGMVIAGMVICAVTSWIAATRYLHKDYGELFKV